MNQKDRGNKKARARGAPSISEEEEDEEEEEAAAEAPKGFLSRL